MAQIAWTKRSIRDLKSIFEYISSDSRIYAFRFVDKVIQRIDQLMEFPESGRIVPEKEDSTIREIIEGNYRIIYKIRRNNITILRIHNSAKKIM